MAFYIVGWKEYRQRKILNRGELIKEENANTAKAKMIELNKRKNITTVDYIVYPLDIIIEKAGLELKEKVN